MNGKKYTIILILSGLIALTLIGCNLVSISSGDDSSGSAAGAQSPPNQAGGQPAGGQAGQQAGQQPGNQGQGQQANQGGQGNQAGQPTPQAPTQQAGPSSCDNGMQLVGSANIAQGEVFEPGEGFQVIWTLKNTGTCPWDNGYTLTHFSGEALGASTPHSLGSPVAPGDTVTVTLSMTAPSTEASYVSLWKMTSSGGEVFGMDNPPDAGLRVSIEVVQAGSGGSGFNLTAIPIPLSTPTPEMVAVPNPNLNTSLFTLISGDQFSLGKNECFGVLEGAEVSCSGSAPSFRWAPNYYLWLDGMEGENGVEFGAYHEDQPTKSECMSSTPFLEHGTVYESTLKNYYCFTVEYGGDTYYGWIRPTYFNNNKIEFDYLTWKP